MDLPVFQEVSRKDLLKREPEEQGKFLLNQFFLFMQNTKSEASPKPQSDNLVILWKADFDEMQRKLLAYEKNAE